MLMPEGSEGLLTHAHTHTHLQPEGSGHPHPDHTQSHTHTNTTQYTHSFNVPLVFSCLHNFGEHAPCMRHRRRLYAGLADAAGMYWNAEQANREIISGIPGMWYRSLVDHSWICEGGSVTVCLISD